MLKTRCYIVDDEPLAIQVIEQHISKLGQFEVCGKTTDPLRAMEEIRSLQPGLIFIDIEMPDLNGLDLIVALPDKPSVIITTAYREFAVEGFDLHVLDYLVKPIPFARFLKAVQKYLEKGVAPPAESVPETPEAVLIKADRKTFRVPLQEILYVEGIKDYCRIVLAGQKIITKVSIGNFLKELPGDRFIRVHKSFVVARSRITAFTALDVEIGGMEIPIGRMYRDEFFRQMETR